MKEDGKGAEQGKGGNNEKRVLISGRGSSQGG